MILGIWSETDCKFYTFMNVYMNIYIHESCIHLQIEMNGICQKKGNLDLRYEIC